MEIKKGLRVRYNNDMMGTVIDQRDNHLLIEFDSGSKFCVLRSSIETYDFFYCQRQIEGLSICEEQFPHCKEYYKPLIQRK